MFLSILNCAPAGRRRGRTSRSAERGVVLIWATISVMIVAGIIVAATDDLKAVDEISRAEFSAKGVAREIAHAGLVDAYAWFRRQPSQPVETFAPALDLEATTKINETDDPEKGLTRTFEISPGLWGRYEVLKGQASEAYTDENGNGLFDADEPYTDSNGDGRWTTGHSTRDVTIERGLAGKGAVWLIEAHAVIFQRPRADLPLGSGHNQRIAHASLATEVRRLTINPPASAALCADNGSAVTVGYRARLRSEAAAIAYGESTGTANTGGAELEGGKTAVPGYKSGVEDVFGVSWTELKSMADISTSDPEAGVPAKLPDFSLIVITGDVVFDQERPLRGTGVVVVQGNCTIASGSNSFFNGLLFVQGQFTARAPAYLRGTVIANGATDIRGTGGDYCELEHDSGMVSRLLTQMGQYRYSKAPYVPLPRLPDGRPHELGLSKRRLGDGYGEATGSGGPLTGGSPGGGGGVEPPPGGEEPPIVEDPPSGFATDGLIDAIETYLIENPGAPGAASLLDAVGKLDLARQRMAQDPANVAGAIGAVRQAMTRLVTAIEEEIPASAFAGELDGGDGTPTLFPQMTDMVETMLGQSSAPAEVVAEATGFYTTGVAKVDRARERMADGNEVGSLSDYRSAAGQLRNAINLIDDY